MSLRRQLMSLLGLTTANWHPQAPITEKLIESDQPVTLTGKVTMSNAQIDFSALPTSDPMVYGQLWNDTGTLTQSAGAG